MKVTFDTKQLETAVSAAAKVVNNSSTIPILTTVLLSANKDGVTVRATDGEVTIQRAVSGAVVHEPGVSAITARVFADYLSKLPKGSVDIATNDQQAMLTSGKAKVTLNCLSAEQFPETPEQNGTFSVVLGAKSFRSTVESTEFAASSEESRGAILMGTLLEIQNDAVTMVATDGYKLSHQSTKILEGSTDKKTIVVPTKALQEVARNLGNSETVTLTLLGKVDNQCRFETEQCTVTVRNVDGTYPSWRSVVPTDYNDSFTINTARLKNALQRISVIARAERSNTLTLKIQRYTLNISATSDASGSAREEIEINGWDAEDMDISFNGSFLLDALAHIEADDVGFFIKNNVSATKLEPTGDVERNDHFIILMPLRA